MSPEYTFTNKKQCWRFNILFMVMNSNYFGDLTISFGHLKNIEATSFEWEKKSQLTLYFWSCTWKSMRFRLSGAKEVFGNGWSHGKGHSFGNSWSSSRYESPSCSWPRVPGAATPQQNPQKMWGGCHPQRIQSSAAVPPKQPSAR